MSRFSEREFRDAMGQFCTGVAVVTGIVDGRPAGLSVQSFVSVSLSPPLVAISPARSSTSWPGIRAARRFGINILGADQQGVCRAFGRSGGDKFEGVDWAPGPGGSPMLAGALCFIACELDAEHEAGDHSIVVGRVTDLVSAAPVQLPLLFFRGRYGSFLSPSEPV